MVSRLLGGAIVILCPSYMNYIIYYVTITLYLYNAISFSSNGKYIYCTHIVYHPSFLPPRPRPLPSFFSHSLSPSLIPPCLLPPSFPLSLPTFLNTRSSRFTIDVYLSYADIESCQTGQSAENTNYKIVKFTVFKRYCFFYPKSNILFQPLRC